MYYDCLNEQLWIRDWFDKELAVAHSLSACHYWTESKEPLLSRWRISSFALFWN